MNIVVCIKQVPEIALVRVEEGSGVIHPDGPGQMNPFDEYAVEEAIRLKEKHGGTVTVMGCGDDSAISGLRDAIALGADKAVLLKDDAFRDSDGVAIGTILAAGIKKLGEVNVVLFGKNAVDTDRSVVPAATAGALGWPQVLFIKKIESIDTSNAVVTRMTEDGYDRVETPLPAVFSVVKEINEPRLPSLKGKMKSKSAQAETWGAGDLGLDTSVLGANSHTKVGAVTPPPPRKKGEILEGDPSTVANTLFEKLREEKVI
ncbi:MAG: electron transfer flavoprotein subunit beta/FixA family protein [Candidatus Zixiibacteriota bacterium]